MSWLYLDPSAWVKRYLAEPGSEVLDALWEQLTQGLARAGCCWLGFAELVWVLQRRRNLGTLNTEAFRRVYQQFRDDCFQIEWLPLSWAQVQASVVWIIKHNLNATDALHLHCALERRGSEERVVLVSADRRLVRAGEAEGLRCIDPERLIPAEVVQQLSAS